MIAIKDRLRRSMVAPIDLIGDPDGIPAEPPSRNDTTADVDDRHVIVRGVFCPKLEGP